MVRLLIIRFQPITPPSDIRNLEYQVQFRASRRIFLAAIFTLLCMGSVTDCLGGESKGWFGFTLTVDADGIFNPTLNSVSITDVAPRSPASEAGLLKGDMVETVDGIVVRGAAANEMKTHLGKMVGETLTLGVRHLDGTSSNATLVARERP